jgi:hypothetical protein
MPSSPPPLPLNRREVVDRYFLEHRAKVLDVAAFLDRVDRAVPGDEAAEDFRLTGLRAAIELMLDGEPGRTGRILALLSDTTDQPIDVAPGKGASGAWDGFRPDEASRGGRG